ncbi:MAG TPA: MmcQ/YjbR family DNA-binding protein [Candidatus Acidoferrum sp.]
MDLDALRKLCLSFPGVTEQIQWGDALLFKVGGKMFAVTNLEPAAVWLSFKVDPELFPELTERPAVIPAPYLARAKWVALESRDAIPLTELAELLRSSYDLVSAKLPRKTRESLLNVNSPRRALAKLPSKSHRASSSKSQKSRRSSSKSKRRK